MSTTRKAHGTHVTGSSSAKEDTRTTIDELKTHHRHSNSADEGIAELDGPTSVPVLLEMLREKDDRIQVLGENISRVSDNMKTRLAGLHTFLIKVQPIFLQKTV